MIFFVFGMMNIVSQHYLTKKTKEDLIMVVFQRYPNKFVFKDPQELLDLFAKLEAENLSLIQECQEAEVSTNRRPVF